MATLRQPTVGRRFAQAGSIVTRLGALAGQIADTAGFSRAKKDFVQDIDPVLTEVYGANSEDVKKQILATDNQKEFLAKSSQFMQQLEDWDIEKVGRKPIYGEQFGAWKGRNDKIKSEQAKQAAAEAAQGRQTALSQTIQGQQPVGAMGRPSPATEGTVLSPAATQGVPSAAPPPVQETQLGVDTQLRTTAPTQPTAPASPIQQAGPLDAANFDNMTDFYEKAIEVFPEGMSLDEIKKNPQFVFKEQAMKEKVKAEQQRIANEINRKKAAQGASQKVLQDQDRRINSIFSEKNTVNDNIVAIQSRVTTLKNIQKKAQKGENPSGGDLELMKALGVPDDVAVNPKSQAFNAYLINAEKQLNERLKAQKKQEVELDNALAVIIEDAGASIGEALLEGELRRSKGLRVKTPEGFLPGSGGSVGGFAPSGMAPSQAVQRRKFKITGKRKVQ